jgi:hypothetical protein
MENLIGNGDERQSVMKGPIRTNKRTAETKENPEDAAASIRATFNAVNANFYFGGFSGSRFNWVGGW